jgi:CheY-like chemotaxis protein
MALIRRKRRDDDGGEAALAAEVAIVERVLGQYPPGTSISFGAPTRCPTCADFGLVEHVDPAGRCANRCLRCASSWEITARGIRAQREARRVVPRAVVPPMSVTFDGPFGARPNPSLSQARPTLDVPPRTGLLFARGAAGDVTRHSLTGPTDHPQPRATPGEQLIPGRMAGRQGPMKVLLVEDNPDDIEVVRAILQPAGPDVIDLRTARTRAAGEAVARSSRPDLVLLDLGLPDSDGVNTVTKWYDHVRDAPVLVVSGDYGRDVVDRGRELGLAGVLDKADLVRLLERGDAGTTAFLDQLSAAAG